MFRVAYGGIHMTGNSHMPYESPVSLLLLHLLDLLGLHSLFWQLPRVHPHIALQNSGYLLTLMFQPRPTEVPEMSGLAGTAQDLQQSNSHSWQVHDRHP